LNLKAQDVAALINVNLLGVVNSVAAVLPRMLERRRGHIAAISSLASFRGLPRLLGYCASKAGVNSFLEGLRLEVKSRGIEVTIVCPGWIRTPITAGLRLPMPQIMEADHAARRIVRALHQRKRFYAFPTSLAWQLRLLGWLPAAISDWFLAWMIRAAKKKG
jgi:short-subunit dehydrogenase